MKVFPVASIPVAGRRHHQPSVSAEERDRVRLTRDETNAFDTNAIEVTHAADGLLGHVPAATARLLAPMMDAGYRFRATIECIAGAEVTILLKMEAK